MIAGELEEGRRLSVATVKKVCSTDRITIEEKYKAPETITPSHTLCLFTNHLPRVGSTDPGTWRRLIVVPFRATIPTQGSRSNYGDILVQEAGPSILAWAIEGAVNFARNSYQLQTPDVVEEVTEAYRGQEDWVGNFLAECCTTAADAEPGPLNCTRHTGHGQSAAAIMSGGCPTSTQLWRRQGFRKLHRRTEKHGWA